MSSKLAREKIIFENIVAPGCSLGTIGYSTVPSHIQHFPGNVCQVAFEIAADTTYIGNARKDPPSTLRRKHPSIGPFSTPPRSLNVSPYFLHPKRQFEVDGIDASRMNGLTTNAEGATNFLTGWKLSDMEGNSGHLPSKTTGHASEKIQQLEQHQDPRQEQKSDVYSKDCPATTRCNSFPDDELKISKGITGPQNKRSHDIPSGFV